MVKLPLDSRISLHSDTLISPRVVSSVLSSKGELLRFINVEILDQTIASI